MRRRKLDRQIDDELAAYIADRAEKLVAAGVSPEEAERRARAELGSVAAVKDEMLDAHVASSWVDGLLKDVRLALRRLVRQPGFTFVAVLTLALGIGGTSAIFSVVKAVLLDPLPYQDPGRLVLVWNELRSEHFAGAGGLIGLALGTLAVDRVAALAPPGLLPSGGPALDAVVVGLTALASGLCGVLFGVAPALDGSRVDLAAAMQAAGRGGTAVAGRRARRMVVTVEMAVGFVLLVGTGLMVRTFMAVQRIDPGFDAAGALSFEISFPAARYAGDAKKAEFARELERELGALPGVSAAGASTYMPLDDYSSWSSPYGPPGTPEEKKRRAEHRPVTPGYLKAVGAELVRGRLLEDADETGAPVVVIDEGLAAEAFPGLDPLGRAIEHGRLKDGQHEYVTSQVVGVVRPIAQHGLTEPERGQIYMPYGRSPQSRLAVVVRGTVDASVARAAVASLDSELAVAKVRPFAFYLDRAQRPARFTMVLASIFGGLALLLAAIGIYGVVATSVSERRRELGVRLALGAEPRDIMRLVLREGAAMALGGLAIGAAASLLLARLLGSLLFGVSPLDPATLAAAAIVLPAAALLASWLPARRAARQSPMASLRTD